MPKPKDKVIIYWSEEDQAFIAEVPELPGCAADGKTHREALANVEVVIKEWIETATEPGRPIPQPKGRLVFAWRPESEACSPSCICPPAGAFRVVNSGCVPHKKWFFGPFFGFDLGSFALKNQFVFTV